MNIIPSFVHPSFCDPRACETSLFADGDVSYEHRSTGMTWTSNAQRDMQITVDVSQCAETGHSVNVGEVNATLRLLNLASVTPGGERLVELAVDLDPCDARMLAAQLVTVAEQVEIIRRQTARGAA